MAQGTNGDSGDRGFAYAIGAGVSIAALALTALIFSAGVRYIWHYEEHAAPSRFDGVTSTLNPITGTVAAHYYKTHKPVLVTTVVTQANSGKPAPPDWAELGFKSLPALPREISALRITPEDDVVVTLGHFGKGIDGTEVRVHLEHQGKGTIFRYSCTSQDRELKRHFDC